ALGDDGVRREVIIARFLRYSGYSYQGESLEQRTGIERWCVRRGDALSCPLELPVAVQARRYVHTYGNVTMQPDWWLRTQVVVEGDGVTTARGEAELDAGTGMIRLAAMEGQLSALLGRPSTEDPRPSLIYRLYALDVPAAHWEGQASEPLPRERDDPGSEHSLPMAPDFERLCERAQVALQWQSARCAAAVPAGSIALFQITDDGHELLNDSTRAYLLERRENAWRAFALVDVNAGTWTYRSLREVNMPDARQAMVFDAWRGTDGRFVRYAVVVERKQRHDGPAWVALMRFPLMRDEGPFPCRFNACESSPRIFHSARVSYEPAVAELQIVDGSVRGLFGASGDGPPELPDGPTVRLAIPVSSW
ncbi:MAG: hypothetical protein AAF411_04605, partial [Myxococcota bacterium]